MIVDQGEEMLMDGGVVSQFRMESCGEYVVFLDQRGFAGEFGEDYLRLWRGELLLRKCRKQDDGWRRISLWLRRDLLPEGIAVAWWIRRPEESTPRILGDP